MPGDLFPVTTVTEPRTIRLDGREIPYSLKRSQQRRSIVLTVDERGLTVSAPWRATERRIVAAVLESADWVLRKLALWSACPARRQSWAEGDGIRFLGQELRLHLMTGRVGASADGEGALQVALPDPSDKAAVQAAVIAWYRREAMRDFLGRIAAQAPRLGVAPPRLFLSSARTRWGSCNVKGDIRLAWRLVQASPATVDYVVVHELAHLIEMNHSRRFWAIVGGACPAYRDACAELDRMGPYYMGV
jgi:predicted metal-dependent hydrolase